MIIRIPKNSVEEKVSAKGNNYTIQHFYLMDEETGRMSSHFMFPPRDKSYEPGDYDLDMEKSIDTRDRRLSLNLVLIPRTKS